MTIKQQIIDLYGNDFIRRSALNLPNGENEISRFMNGDIKVAVEIGTLRGCTSVVMSKYCDKLYTFDLKSGQIENRDWQSKDNRYSLWNKLGINNIELILINNDKEKEKIIDNLEFDFAFIDGDHSFEGVKKDFDIVKKCGRVLFHDYDARLNQPCYVRDFINTIKYGKFEYTIDFAYWAE